MKGVVDDDVRRGKWQRQQREDGRVWRGGQPPNGSWEEDMGNVVVGGWEAAEEEVPGDKERGKKVPG